MLKHPRRENQFTACSMPVFFSNQFFPFKGSPTPPPILCLREEPSKWRPTHTNPLGRSMINKQTRSGKWKKGRREKDTKKNAEKREKRKKESHVAWFKNRRIGFMSRWAFELKSRVKIRKVLRAKIWKFWQDFNPSGLIGCGSWRTLRTDWVRKVERSSLGEAFSPRGR